MDPLTIVLFISLAVHACMVIVLLFGRKKIKENAKLAISLAREELAAARKSASLVMDLAEKELATSNAALDRGTALMEQNSDLVETLNSELKLQRERADHNFGVIEGVIRERDGIWRMYRATTRAAGVAQAWLMRELVEKTHALNGAHKQLGRPPVEIDPQLRRVVDEFTSGAASLPEVPPKGPEADSPG